MGPLFWRRLVEGSSKSADKESSAAESLAKIHGLRLGKTTTTMVFKSWVEVEPAGRG